MNPHLYLSDVCYLYGQSYLYWFRFLQYYYCERHTLWSFSLCIFLRSICILTRVCSNAFSLQNRGFNSSQVDVGHVVDKKSLNSSIFEQHSFFLSVSFHNCPKLVYSWPTLFNFSIWKCRSKDFQHTTHTTDSEREESDWSLSLDINENSAHNLLLSVLFSSAFYLLHFFSTKGVKKTRKKICIKACYLCRCGFKNQVHPISSLLTLFFLISSCTHIRE